MESAILLGNAEERSSGVLTGSAQGPQGPHGKSDAVLLSPNECVYQSGKTNTRTQRMAVPLCEWRRDNVLNYQGIVGVRAGIKYCRERGVCVTCRPHRDGTSALWSQCI